MKGLPIFAALATFLVSLGAPSHAQDSIDIDGVRPRNRNQVQQYQEMRRQQQERQQQQTTPTIGGSGEGVSSGGVSSASSGGVSSGGGKNSKSSMPPLKVTFPTKGNVLSPNLVEGGSGFSTNAPSATGTPRTPTAPSRPAGGTIR